MRQHGDGRRAGNTGFNSLAYGGDCLLAYKNAERWIAGEERKIAQRKWSLAILEENTFSIECVNRLRLVLFRPWGCSSGKPITDKCHITRLTASTLSAAGGRVAVLLCDYHENRMLWTRVAYTLYDWLTTRPTATTITCALSCPLIVAPLKVPCSAKNCQVDVTFYVAWSKYTQLFAHRALCYITIWPEWSYIV